MDKRKQRLAQLNTDIKAKNDQVNAIFDAVDKRDGKETQEEKDQIKGLHQEIETLLTERGDLAETLGIRDAAAKRTVDFDAPQRGAMFEGGDGGNGDSVKSFGRMSDQVLGDDAVKSWLDQNQATFKSSLHQQIIQSPKVMVKSLFEDRRNVSLETLKALITGVSETSAGPLVFPDFKPIVDASYQRPLTVRDLITIGQTTSDQVEYVRVNTPTNNAAPVAEATASDDGSGAKPESALPFERIAEAVKTIAHWVPATTRSLADAGQLRTYIDQFLRYGIDEELEDQILNGSGSGENFTGVLNVSGNTPQAWDTDILTTTRKARTKVRITGRTIPTAYVMNPADWETIDLLQDNEARYYYGGPMRTGTPTLWGLPVVESEGMPAGTAMVANWKLAVLWDRMETMISMSNSHSDFFTRNLVAILAEMRAAFGVIRPKAFVEIDTAA